MAEKMSAEALAIAEVLDRTPSGSLERLRVARFLGRILGPEHVEEFDQRLTDLLDKSPRQTFPARDVLRHMLFEIAAKDPETPIGRVLAGESGVDGFQMIADMATNVKAEANMSDIGSAQTAMDPKDTARVAGLLRSAQGIAMRSPSDRAAQLADLLGTAAQQVEGGDLADGLFYLAAARNIFWPAPKAEALPVHAGGAAVIPDMVFEMAAWEIVRVALRLVHRRLGREVIDAAQAAAQVIAPLRPAKRPRAPSVPPAEQAKGAEDFADDADPRVS